MTTTDTTVEPTDIETADPRTPNADGFVAADYARAVTFADRYWRSEDDDAETSWPVHVVGSRIMHQWDVELDGRLVPGVKDAAVSFGIEEATLVTLYVDPNLCDVAPPARFKDDGRATPGAIDGHLLLTPYRGGEEGPGWSWDWERELVVCEFYAQRVVFE